MMLNKGALLVSSLTLALLSLTACQSTKMHDKANKPTIPSPRPHLTSDNLANYHWRLANALDASQQPVEVLSAVKDEIILEFSNHNGSQHLSFSSGCNSMGGSYKLNQGIMEVEQLMTTLMLCDELAEAEETLIDAMQVSSELLYHQGPPTALTQITSSGYVLSWQGERKTHEQASQLGDTVFWEIDSDKQLCPDGLSQACLKVRAVTYDSNGIKQGVGDWDLFIDNIEGYRHDSQFNQIVRLKRFTTNPANVKGKQFVYVFDTVVESDE